jgi:arsenite methyltransferase
VDLKEQDVIMVLTDISGYTAFMKSNETSLAHSQMVVAELLTALLEEVALPLTLSKVEGDALFLYAVKEGDEMDWEQARKGISEKFYTFFHTFAHKAEELNLHSICKCSACTNIDKLRLKVVAHSGKMVFSRIGTQVEISGIDAIIAHRLLKNSVKGDQYILMTEQAQRDIPLPGLKSWESQETYDEIGTIKTTVYLAPEPPPYVPDATVKYSSVFRDSLRQEVQKEYSEVATHPEKGFHFHTGRKLAEMLGYQKEWLEGIPELSAESFAGTGNPFSVGLLRSGEHVVDVGSGAGIDSLIAGKMVGSEGRVIGVDMTPAMLEKARASAAQMGTANVEFRHGFAEELPVEDGWADVIISNGVINLCPDKSLAFREMFRVLRPDGRLQIGDILVKKAVPESAKKNIDLWTG